MKMLVCYWLQALAGRFLFGWRYAYLHSVVVFGDNAGLESDGLRDHHHYYDLMAILSESLRVCFGIKYYKF